MTRGGSPDDVAVVEVVVAPRSDVTTVLATVSTKATKMPQITPTPKPSTILEAVHTMTPFRSSAATPKVNTVIGSANLTNSGHITALRRPITAAIAKAELQLGRSISGVKAERT